jgi:hypothetical protein
LESAEKIWMDGNIVEWRDAHVHVGARAAPVPIISSHDQLVAVLAAATNALHTLEAAAAAQRFHAGRQRVTLAFLHEQRSIRRQNATCDFWTCFRRSCRQGTEVIQPGRNTAPGFLLVRIRMLSLGFVDVR